MRRPKRWCCSCSFSGSPCCNTSTAAALRSSTDEAGPRRGVSADRAGGGRDDAALLLDGHHSREPSAGYHRVPAQVDPQSPDPGPFPGGRSQGAVVAVLQEQSGCGDGVGRIVRVVRPLRGLRVCRLQVPAAEFLLSVDPGDADGAVQVTSVSLYVFLAKFNWVDTYAGILAPNFASAFGVFLI